MYGHVSIDFGVSCSIRPINVVIVFHEIYPARPRLKTMFELSVQILNRYIIIPVFFVISSVFLVEVTLISLPGLGRRCESMRGQYSAHPPCLPFSAVFISSTIGGQKNVSE